MFNSASKGIYIAIFSLLGLAAVIALLVLALQNTLFVIVIMFMLAYILNPLVELLERRAKFKRWVTSALVSLTVLFVLALIPIFIGPLVLTQIKDILLHIPNIVAMINENLLIPVNAKFDTKIVLEAQSIKDSLFSSFNSISSVNFKSVAPIAMGGLSLLSGLVEFILAPFILFFIIRDWAAILAFLNKLIPQRYTDSAHVLLKDIDKSLSYYLRGQVFVMLIMAFIYALAFNLISLPAGTMVGVITGLLVFIPYIGLLSGTLLAILMAFSHYQGMGQIIQILVIIGVGNLVENFIFTPLLVGNSLGLNPIMIIIALIICGNLFGIVGVIAALPITAISTVLFKHIINAYLESDYYKKKPSKARSH